MIEPDDAVLVERSLGGDTRAFGDLVGKYQGPVFNIALRLTHDADEANDVAQATFVKAFEKLQTFDTKRKFFSWLYRIAVNESLSACQRLNRREPIREDVAAEEAGTDDAAGEKETASRVLMALQELKLDLRAVIVLRHFQNLSYQEIGQVLDLPERTVKSRLFTARTMLRDILVKRGIRAHD
jgi:RNA polymerase sigma-70 factor (ECF subfamily)